MLIALYTSFWHRDLSISCYRSHKAHFRLPLICPPGQDRRQLPRLAERSPARNPFITRQIGMQAEILLTMKLQQRLFADPRRIALLKQIHHTGSISQGAKLAGISYKSAWDAISSMNDLAEQTLVERATGGKGGGGATLTRYAQRLLQLYDLLGQIQQKAFDVLQDDRMPLDSLLAAISRFSLQTSARNQFFGTVLTRSHQQVQQHVDIQLADGQTRLAVALTEQSAERLGLVPGK